MIKHAQQLWTSALIAIWALSSGCISQEKSIRLNTVAVSKAFALQSPVASVPALSTINPKGIRIGASGHPSRPDYGNLETQFQILQARGLSVYRVGAAPTSTNIAPTQSWVAMAAKYHIKLSYMLNIEWLTCGSATCPNESVFTSSDPATLYNIGYTNTFNFVSQFADSITDWELGNELDWKSGCGSGSPCRWGNGWSESAWSGISFGGTTDYYLNWSYVLRGMTEAIRNINVIRGTHLRAILNTTGTNFGFLTYMKNHGVQFDVVSYHYYQSYGTDPTSLSGPSANGPGRWNLFSVLGSLGVPIHVNEFNCAEIYSPSFTNSSTDPLYGTCVQNLNFQLRSFLNATNSGIEEIDAYELFDEPSQAAPENRFGLFWNGPGGPQPKASLLLFSQAAGIALTPSEQNTLSTLGIH